MKIGIDITMLVYTGSGVANYTFNLVKNLLKIDKENEYRLFYSSFRRPKNFSQLEELKKLGAKIYDLPIPTRVLKSFWNQFYIIPVEWCIGKVDIYHSSDFLRPPLLKGTKGITTVHDLTWKIYPQYHEQRIIEAHAIKLKKTIKYNDTVITDSLSTKKDLSKYFQEINTKKVQVVYPGIGEQFKLKARDQELKMILEKYFIDLEDKFLLYVGAIEPRKNLVLAINIFNELVKDSRFSDFKFVITGRAGWKNENVFQSIKQLGLENKVRFTGFVVDEDLPYLYNAASLTIYLSAYEGFGLPPLESLACGTKVIVGDNSSLRETISPEFLVDLSDRSKILEKMKYLLSNEIKINSEEIQEKFNWKKSAQQFLKIIIAINN